MCEKVQSCGESYPDARDKLPHDKRKREKKRKKMLIINVPGNVGFVKRY